MSPIREYTTGVIKRLIGTIQSYQVNVVTYLVALAVLAVLALLIFYILKVLVFGILRRWAKNQKLIFLRVITHNGTLNLIPHLISAMIFLSWIRFVQVSSPVELIIQQFVRYAALLYVFICLALLLTRLVWAINTYYEKKYEFAQEYPIYSYIKVVILLIWVIWTVLVAAYFAGMSPISILTGIGAISAVVILVFKDTLLGVVASIQITASNIVNIGDRITIDKYNVDGEVLDIAINTVKVKNSDNTIATIPTYVLISEVVKNWRGMVHAGARRIKRAIHIDINTIAKCSPELLESLRQFKVINDYIEKQHGRDIINITLYREYLRDYLAKNPYINHDYTTLIRHLDSSVNGLPIEIYTFTNDVAFVEYENVQSEIFEHCFSVVPQFGLKILQYPNL